MKLHGATEVSLNSSGLLCRQSRLWGLVGTVLICAFLAAFPLLWWQLGAPWPVWGGCTLLAMVTIPLLIHDLLLRLRSSSWLLWIRTDGLWIRFRSYQDDSADDGTAAVAQLDYTEIRRIQPLVEIYSTPSGDGQSSVRHREEALLILLNSAGSILNDALAIERSRQPSKRTVLGFVRVASKASHFPVTMPSPNVIRLAWRGGHGHQLAPPLGRAVDELRKFTETAELVRRTRPSWSDMDDSQLQELIRHLVETGARIDAIRLLVRRKNYTTTEAHKHTEELARQSANVLPG